MKDIQGFRPDIELKVGLRNPMFLYPKEFNKLCNEVARNSLAIRGH
jgi:hypothetical protein